MSSHSWYMIVLQLLLRIDQLFTARAHMHTDLDLLVLAASISILSIGSATGMFPSRSPLFAAMYNSHT